MKSVIVGAVIIAIVFLLFWAKYAFYLPHYYQDSSGDLVYKAERLVLVTKTPESKITIPKHLPFWRATGVVDGYNSGTLFVFYDHGTKYILFQSSTEMPWQWIYRPATDL